MEQIERKVRLDVITGDTINLQLYLTQSVENIGFFTDVEESVISTDEGDKTDAEFPNFTSGGDNYFSEFVDLDDFTNGVTTTITGETTHKLDTIRAYGAVEYQVGVNGVTNITDDFIEYTIGEINYKTFFETLFTTFETTSKGCYEGNTSINNQIKRDVYMGMISPPEIDNNIFIERSRISVFENHLRLSEVKNLDHLIDYGNKYFEIKE